MSNNSSVQAIQDLTPNSLLVEVKPNTNRSVLETAKQSLRSNHPNLQFCPVFQYQNQPVYPTNQIIVALKANNTINQINALFGNKIERAELNNLTKSYLLTLKNVKDLFSLTESIFQSGLVEYAEPNFISGSTQNPLFPNQYYLNNTGQNGGTPNIDINAPEAWALVNNACSANARIRVAVIDDGVEEHEDLGNLLPIGFDARNPANPGRPMQQELGHGQACAGIIGADNNQIGIRGVATNVDILPVRIFFWGVDNLGRERTIAYTNAEIAASIEWAWRPQFGNADVLSNSWGGGVPNNAITSAIDNARTQGRENRGCIVIFASGNLNQLFSGVTFPANVEGVLTVGAIDRQGSLWAYSSRGPEMDLVAPSGNTDLNGDIVTLDRMGANGFENGNYTFRFGGTSAACPQVAGVAALVLQANPNLTEAQVRQILQETARDLGSPGFDNSFGFGLVDAEAAVRRVLIGNIFIVGTPSICQTGTYTLSGVPNGANVVWSVGSNLQIISQSNTQIQVSTSVSSNQQTFIEATLTFCGGITTTIRQNITLTPVAVSQMQIQGPTEVWRGQFVNYRIDPVPGATGYRWWVVPVNGATSQPIIPYNCSGYFCWEFAPGHNGTGTNCSFKVGETDGQIYVEALGTNVCNSGTTTLRAVYQATGCPPNGQKCFNVRIANPYPNPIQNSLQIKIEHPENDAEVLAVFAESSYNIALYNAQGELKAQMLQVQGLERNISLTHLPQGMYYLHIQHPEFGLLQKTIVKE